MIEVPRNIAHPGNEMDSFLLYLPEEIIRLVLRHTNRKVRDIMAETGNCPFYMRLFSYEEFLACIGILLRAASDRDNFTELDELWTVINGKPFYRAVLSKSRFKFFLRSIRFDNYRTREMRKLNDRLAAISEVWDTFVSNLRRVYIPGATLTVDEQLLGYRGKVPGRTYMPSKPKKYGLKIFWLCEARTGFALNGQIYTGRGQNEPIHRNLGKDVVLELCKPFFGTNRDIVTDNFFTSHSLACDLLSNGLTLLGTVRKQRKELPTALFEKDRDVFSTLFLYDHISKITLAAYIPARHRLVILLSSSHGRGVITPNDPKMRPEMITDYNLGKGGVDQMDENLAEFSSVRKTARWPLLVFFNIIDVAANNSFIHLKRGGYTKSRKEFLRQLASDLARKFAIERHQTNKALPISTTEAAKLFGYRNEPDVQQEEKSLGRCNTCSKVSRSRCDRCGKRVCPNHRRLNKVCLCLNCI